jgi:hypothetical protein
MCVYRSWALPTADTVSCAGYLHRIGRFNLNWAVAAWVAGVCAALHRPVTLTDRKRPFCSMQNQFQANPRPPLESA